jgi:hypothetical protein
VGLGDQRKWDVLDAPLKTDSIVVVEIGPHIHSFVRVCTLYNILAVWSNLLFTKKQ